MKKIVILGIGACRKWGKSKNAGEIFPNIVSR